MTGFGQEDRRGAVWAAALTVLAIALASWPLVLAHSAQAAACGGAEYEFVGGHGNLWETAANWKEENVPTAAHTACIAAGLPPVEVATASAAAKWLTALSPLVITGSGTLTLPADNKGFAREEPSSFTDLTVEAGGHLTGVDAPIKVKGNAVINGVVGGDGKYGDDLEYMDSTGALSGTGTIGANLVGLEGTLAPGGQGVVGVITFTHGIDTTGPKFTWAIDIASELSFDEVHYEAGGEAQVGSATVEGHLIGGYSPAVGTKWHFLMTGSGFCTLNCGVGSKGFKTSEVSGGGDLEITEAPPVGPQPPALEATPENTQGRFRITPPANHGTQQITEYELTVEPGSHHIGSLLYTSPNPIEITLTSLTNCVTYTATAVDKTSVGTSAPSTAVKFTPEGPEGCGSKPGSKGGEGPGASEEHVATSPAAVEELALGCSGRKLVLNDVYIHGGRVAIAGSAAKSLIGKKVTILFNEKKQVATATVASNGQFAATAPLPPKKIREALTTRYSAEIGSLRSVHLKLTRRLLLEPPKVSGTTVTLSGTVTPPLTKPIAPVVVEQQLECGRTTIARRFTPPASGRFKITLTIPPGAKAAIFRLTSSVAQNSHSTKKGFNTFSLPLPLTTAQP